MNIRIIPAGSPGYDAMIALRIHALLEPIGIPATYIDREAEKNDIFIGAFNGAKIMGCCVLTPKEDGSIQLRQMAVMPGLQGQGMGRKIVAFAEEEAREQGFTRLVMHARDPVIAFYEKCGYKTVGPQFFEVGMGHHRMEKAL